LEKLERVETKGRGKHKKRVERDDEAFDPQ
jgi:hypothetical protein